LVCCSRDGNSYHRRRRRRRRRRGEEWVLGWEVITPTIITQNTLSSASIGHSHSSEQYRPIILLLNVKPSSWVRQVSKDYYYYDYYYYYYYY